MPEPMVAVELRALAARAIDAAREAGASYADARVAEQHLLKLWLDNGSEFESDPELASEFSYGVRVLVDGAWAFVHGTVPTADALAVAAREAVVTARGYARLNRRPVELVPAPAATGEWSTPFAVDPFDVPLEDHTALMHAYRDAARRVRHGSEGPGIEFRWTRETRVFASSEGSIVTQTLRRSVPWMRAAGSVGMGNVFLNLPGVDAMSGGYEVVAAPELQDEMKRTSEEAVQLASLPRRGMDVGRYSVVFDGFSMGTTIGRTIGQGLELDRVLGYEGDASGTSFLAPPAEIMGATLFSPLLTVRAGRAVPTINAVRWDDEGVEPHEYPVITKGRVVDYHTSRGTASVLRTSYEREGRPIESRGCAVAQKCEYPVVVRAPHLMVAPATDAATLENLCREIQRGVLVRGAIFALDPQLVSGSLPYDGMMYEIERGKVVRRIVGSGLQFRTGQLFRASLMALGDSSTVRQSTFQADKGQPWRPVTQSASAPAALFKDVDLVSTKIRL